MNTFCYRLGRTQQRTKLQYDCVITKLDVLQCITWKWNFKNGHSWVFSYIPCWSISWFVHHDSLQETYELGSCSCSLLYVCNCVLIVLVQHICGLFREAFWIASHDTLRGFFKTKLNIICLWYDFNRMLVDVHQL